MDGQDKTGKKESKRKKTQADNRLNGTNEETHRTNRNEVYPDREKSATNCPYTPPLSDGFGISTQTCQYRCKRKCRYQQPYRTNRQLCYTKSSTSGKQSRWQTHETKELNASNTTCVSVNNVVWETKLNSDEPDFMQDNKPLYKRGISDRYAPYNGQCEAEVCCQGNMSQTYPTSSKKRNEYNIMMETDDLETDTIIPSEVYDKHMPGAPCGLPGDYKDMKPKNQPLPQSISVWKRIGLLHDKEPDQISTVYIPHESADEPIGDKFGVDIWTYHIKQSDGTVYYQHFFVEVDPSGPAGKMKIRNNDEIVLVNGEFVPHITHTDLLNRFHHVKVDTKTRFRLMIRRIEKTDSSKKQWDWIETSAILAPDLRHLDKYPSVENAEFSLHTGDEKEVEPKIKEYGVPGTQYFLDIRNDRVIVDVKTRTDADRTKRICKRSRYKVDPNDPQDLVHYWAALADEEKNRYISVGQGNKITLDNKPMWFRFNYDGSKIWFKINELFLSCNRETCQVETDFKEFKFDESSTDEGLDFPDCHTSSASPSYNFRVPASTAIPSTHGNATVSTSADMDNGVSTESTSDDMSTPAKCYSSGVACSNGGYEGSNTKNIPHTPKYFTRGEARRNPQMTLNIPVNSNTCNSKSPLEIIKTPTTPFASLSMKIIN